MDSPLVQMYVDLGQSWSGWLLSIAYTGLLIGVSVFTIREGWRLMLRLVGSADGGSSSWGSDATATGDGYLSDDGRWVDYESPDYDEDEHVAALRAERNA